jgi:predicted ATPase/serine phosphatase RsbU (regulator of sigma subunit)/serine/threonine protein kinase
MLTLPNYQISTPIYESANSLVYQGVRSKDNQPVILKMLKQDYPTPAELTRYRQEYEITHDLNLAGIIKAFSIEKYQNTLIIIFQDFGGESLKATLENGSLSLSKRGISVADFLPLAIQIADSLGNIHAANIIHKDINPSNIVVNVDTNQLKIIDFGIASRLPRENLTLKSPEQLEGTLAYLSPEQTGRINRSLDYRTDLYSLGVTFYEMLTGSLPFTATDAMELVHCHLAKTPTPVCEVNPDVPPIISDIVKKLLAKNAEDRYQSAFGVKADLEKVQENLPGFKNLAGLSFELAQNDFSGKLQIPQKLYGRDPEVKTLLQAFERICKGTAEMMLVAGYSGVGKTALVHEVHKPMTSRRGYFAAGKFDQFQKNMPYSAITQAFNEFCRYLLMESSETLANWQTKILEVVGNNGQIIIDVIPDLELVIGTQPAVASVGPTEAQNRFNLFFLNFVKALCDKEHPFILFIDDLQWVDSASLGLLKSIMLDDEIRHLLIIGAYRDNEVDSTHPLILARDELQKANVNINTIFLANLLEVDVNQLLQESLSCETALSQPLTDLIYQKTQGNAFFTHQFLHTLYSEALLQFNFEQLKWHWDVERIAAQNMTANVVELMANKLDKLPKKTSKVLQLAACMGNQLDLSLLAIIYGQDQNETLSVLWHAIKEGLIQPLDENYKRLDVGENSTFKFLHDRVQQAAYSLIEEDKQKEIHLQIGRLLSKEESKDMSQERIFEITDHFNIAMELLKDDHERVSIANLNQMAGKKAFSAMAIEAAIQYFQTGLRLLPETRWETHYALTFNLTCGLIESFSLNTSFQKAEELCHFALPQAQSNLDKASIYALMCSNFTLATQLGKTLEIGLQALETLNISLVENLHQMVDIEQLRDLPEMKAPDKLATMSILANMISSAVIIQSPLLGPLTYTMVELSIKYGNCTRSLFGYIYYSLLLTLSRADIALGYQLGILAVELIDKFKACDVETKVLVDFSVLIRHFSEHARLPLNELPHMVQLGKESGSIEHGTYAAVNYVTNLLLLGEPLADITEKQATYLDWVKKTGYSFSLDYGSIWAQTTQCLRGQGNSLTELKGDFIDECLMIPELEQNQIYLNLFAIYAAKAMLSYFNEDFQESFNFAKKTEQYLNSIPGLFPITQPPFYGALAFLKMMDEKSNKESDAILETYEERLQVWSKHGSMNFQHKYDLVEAEKARVLGQNWEAAELYEKAIAGAKENEYLHEEALTYELAAEFYLGRGMDKIAKTYLKEAHYRYQQWGALAKVKDLETKYPQFLAPKTARAMKADATILGTMMVSTSTKSGSSFLDLNSIMKAAQTLSGEIVLSRLLEKMMQIVIENAGAQRGFLILPLDDKWVIEAEGAIDKEEVTVLHSLPIENNLPEVIVNYVARTQENVVLVNASYEGIYTENPYIKAHQTQSVLCFPIVYQLKLRAILYFENSLTTGAFTPQRLNVLKMLSSQIAISLENAQYATQLENKVKQRTKQLATANEEITALNEQLKSDNLRMSAELDVSRHLQQMLLPKDEELEAINSLDIAGFMEPADEVGGDYYDVLQHNGRILFGIGDVTGHGLESGALAIMVQSTIRGLLANNETDPVKFFSALNQMVFHNVQRMNVEKSLTLALVDYKENQLYLSGQHEEMIVVQNGDLKLIDTIDLGFPIGLDENIAEFVNQVAVPLNAGDVVVLYTDGITEAFNMEKKEYGLERLCEITRQNWQKTAHEIQQAVIDDVRQFIGEQKVFDDITLLVLKQK